MLLAPCVSLFLSCLTVTFLHLLLPKSFHAKSTFLVFILNKNMVVSINSRWSFLFIKHNSFGLQISSAVLPSTYIRYTYLGIYVIHKYNHDSISQLYLRPIYLLRCNSYICYINFAILHRWTSGQSYKHFMLINYDSRVVPDWKIPHITTLES